MSHLVLAQSLKDFLERTSNNPISNILLNSQKDPILNRVLVKSEEFNYISFGDGGLVNFLPKSKELELGERGAWKKTNRQSGKPSKVIRKLLTEYSLSKLTPQDFEEFANLYKTKGLGTEFKFEIVTGHDIAETYDSTLYKDKGTLGGSCMNGDSEYLSIYTENSNVSIIRLIHTQTGHLAGRALLWTLDDGERFMDRVYYIEDYMVNLFKDYAKEEGIQWCKVYQSYDSKNYWENLENGEKVYKNVAITVNQSEICSFPYIDTFSFGDGVSTLYNTDEFSYERCYNQTDGDYEGGNNRQYCNRYDSYYELDDLIMVTAGEREDEYVLLDDYVRINGDIYSDDDDDVIFSELEQEYILHSDSVECISTGEYCSTHYAENYLIEIEGDYYSEEDENIVCVNDEWYLKTDSVLVEIGGEYYHTLEDDGDTICITDNEWHLIEDTVEIDGERYLKNSDDVRINEEGEWEVVEK